MIEIGKYYKMIKKGYEGFRYYIKDIQFIHDSINQLYSIYYETSNICYYDSVISNNEFWNKGNFEEITVDQFVMDYKGTDPLPVKSDIFHTLLF